MAINPDRIFRLYISTIKAVLIAIIAYSLAIVLPAICFMAVIPHQMGNILETAMVFTAGGLLWGLLFGSIRFRQYRLMVRLVLCITLLWQYFFAFHEAGGVQRAGPVINDFILTILLAQLAGSVIGLFLYAHFNWPKPLPIVWLDNQFEMLLQKSPQAEDSS